MDPPTQKCLNCGKFGLAIGDDFTCDEIEMLDVVEIENLQINALCSGIPKAPDGGDCFGHGSCGTVCPQFIGFSTDCRRAPDKFGFVAACSYHERRGIAQ